MNKLTNRKTVGLIKNPRAIFSFYKSNKYDKLLTNKIKEKSDQHKPRKYRDYNNNGKKIFLF